MTGTPHEDRSAPPGALTLVTVVFEPEVPLLALQARSLARFVPESVFARIIVIDNTRRGLPRRVQSRLLREYGPWRSAVTFLRPDDISPLPPSRGWIGQQVLKLAVHAQVATDFYLVLDAKNHWLRGTGRDTFLNPDGRARGASHEYRRHPLRATLVRVLDYLGVDPDPWIDGFPATHTPVVLATAEVRRLTADVTARAGRSFAEEFVGAGLTEFFLYAGWLVATYGGLDGHLDGTVIRSANVWPGRRSAADFSRTLAAADEHDAPFLSVHRTALARARWSAVSELADFWTARGLFPDRRHALAFTAAYRVRFVWSMSLRKLRTTLGARLRLPGAGRGEAGSGGTRRAGPV